MLCVWGVTPSNFATVGVGHTGNEPLLLASGKYSPCPDCMINFIRFVSPALMVRRLVIWVDHETDGTFFTVVDDESSDKPLYSQLILLSLTL